MRKWIILMTIAAVLSLGVFVFANGSSTTVPSNQPSISAQTQTNLSASSDESISETAESPESGTESLRDSTTDTDNIQSQVEQTGNYQGNY
ncbi:MAG: hypothetical protein M1521_01315 [Thermotogae bacterium]|nr:hypothetical protein [Thermotogota bacterium]